MKLTRIGFGGGCHWCTESVFSVIKGVEKVDQGWIKSISPYNRFSEAVIVCYDPDVVSLDTLLKVHLETHSSTSNHRMRNKYRSAVYYFNERDKNLCEKFLKEFSAIENESYITKILSFSAFKRNDEQYLQYYKKNKNAPFCKTHIDPKISYLKENYPEYLSD